MAFETVCVIKMIIRGENRDLKLVFKKLSGEYQQESSKDLKFQILNDAVSFP
jgi:hypothetical protein